MKTALICHRGERLNAEILARWLASFSTLSCLILIDEGRAPLWRRIKAERRRVGLLRLADVFAFKVFYRLFMAAADRAWERAYIERLEQGLPALPKNLPVLVVANPNEPRVPAFLTQHAPELVIARCKWLLRSEVFALPRLGTFVMHPGHCPEYRNSHGCFWALVRRELDKVAMTLLKIDAGIDTGPIYARHSCRFDERAESHIRIQHRVVFDNLEPLKTELLAIGSGALQPLPAGGAFSANWGQPWLSAYLAWQRAARRAGAPS